MVKRVVILGGGVAALSTAWQLTNDPGWRQKIGSIHIYQMGWRLGGKCASGRGPMRRIEEHGIHLFGGGYVNTLPMMRAVFRELRGSDAAGDQAFHEAFVPQATSVRVGPDGSKQVVRLRRNARAPEDIAAIASPTTLHLWAAAALTGMRNYLVDDDDDQQAGPGGILVSNLAPLAGLLGMANPATTPNQALAQVDDLIQALQARDLATAASLAGTLKAASDGFWPGTATDSLPAVVMRVRGVVAGAPQFARLALVLVGWSLALDFIAALVHAWLDLMQSTTTLEQLDAETTQTLLAAHGARVATLQSDLVLGPIRILYQFRDGDPDQPSLGAGCFLHWMLRTFAYAGTPFWFFAEGTGETFIRPLYELLVRRGVAFHFFHKVEQIALGAEGKHIEALTFRVQADLPDGAVYQPLDRGCWPDRPLHRQLVNGEEIAALPADALESYWSRYREGRTTTLTIEPQDDAVVLAIPPAALPAIAPGLLDQVPALQTVHTQVASVETQSLQLWLDATSNALGVNTGSNQPIGSDDTGLGAGFVPGFHTFSDFSDLLQHESWPACSRPQALWYFSDSVPTDPGPIPFHDPDFPARRLAAARSAARSFTATAFGLMLPDGAPTKPPRFDPRHLVVPDESQVGGPDSRFDQQYVHANFQPSERYVQALPGTTAARPAAGKCPGLGNLFLAGDWTFNGLNVGCVEATVMSGKLAGNALLQCVDPHAGVAGYFPR